MICPVCCGWVEASSGWTDGDVYYCERCGVRLRVDVDFDEGVWLMVDE